MRVRAVIMFLISLLIIPSSCAIGFSSTDFQESNFSITEFSQAYEIKNYIQPSKNIIELISPIHTLSSTKYKKKTKKIPPFIIVNDIPYFIYWQGSQEEYIFHPKAFGSFISALSCNAHIQEYLKKAIKTAYKLPNGGLLWYYPDNFKLYRFIGPDLSPSAMSQSMFLGTITDLDQRCNLNLSLLAHKIFLGLIFSYYQGGVNLDNRFLLELPLLHSPPEIILNGWLYSLLHLKKYIDFYHDPEAENLFNNNIRTLAKSLSSFHDSNTGLSLYSNLTPYRIRLYYSHEYPTKLFVFYKSHISGIRNLTFKLKLNKIKEGIYNNHISKITKKYIDIWVSCSQMYDTFLVADKSFYVKFFTGRYSPFSSIPKSGGEAIILESKIADNYNIVNITSVRNKLFCGYPTNFLKPGGKNYYHIYHIVALLCLLDSEKIPKNVQDIFKFWIKRWMKTVKILENKDKEKFRFSSYKDVLRTLLRYKQCNIKKWGTLIRKLK